MYPGKKEEKRKNKLLLNIKSFEIEQKIIEKNTPLEQTRHCAILPQSSKANISTSHSVSFHKLKSFLTKKKLQFKTFKLSHHASKTLKIFEKGKREREKMIESSSINDEEKKEEEKKLGEKMKLK